MEPRKPSLDNISIEDLIDLAHKEATVDESSKITDVGLFILETGVTKSEQSPPVEGPNIYWAYCKWCKANDKVPLRRAVFFKEFKTRFEVTNQWHGGIRFWIDPKPFVLDKEEWWEMRRALRREPNYKKKNPKK